MRLEIPRRTRYAALNAACMVREILGSMGLNNEAFRDLTKLLIQFQHESLLSTIQLLRRRCGFMSDGGTSL